MANKCTWIVDSGASDHMTADVNLLVNVKHASKNLTINLPTGDVSHITHVGDVRLKCGLILHNVLVVPQFQHNLLSIHKLAKDNKCDVKFTPLTCEILKADTKEVQATGHIYSGLYYLTDADGASCNSPTVSSNTWHLRLGHAAMSTIEHIPQLSSSITSPMAKFSKLPYALSTSHASNAFDLVYIDTWGPYRVCTRGQFRYFLTIVDDMSRVTWLYLMKQKSDFIDCFQAFFNYVHTHFATKIKCLRSDNAPEFFDDKCKRF